MKITRRKGLLLAVILIILGYSLVLYLRYPQISPVLPPLPTPVETPASNVPPFEVDRLILNTTAIEFHIFLPHYGPNHIQSSFDLNVSNTGAYDITDFHVVKATFFTEDLKVIYTFDITTDNATIEAGNYRILRYNAGGYVPRDSSFSEYWFLRILVTFDTNKEAIITTPLCEIWMAIE